MLFRKSTSALVVLAVTAIASGAMIVSASTTINQIGSDIDGEAAGDYSGVSMSLSSDGTIVAIGAYGNDGAAANAGHVRVYEWNGSAWTQKGADIDGEAADDRSGMSMSLSSDGTIVAIGALYNAGNGNNSGHVRVFEWDGTAWQQKGDDIDGEAAGDY
ncbi:MAG: T9SS C-terminal target domain-containing protein, partial [Ilumatobacteraceae bacterium]